MDKVKHEKFTTCKILGAEIAVINMRRLIEYVVLNIRSLKNDYIVVSNIHTTMMGYENEEYLQIQKEAALCIPDGGPLSVIAKKRGYCDIERTTGPDFMDEIFKISEKNGYRHYFYGSTQNVIEALEKNLKEKYPELQITGMYSPPFKAETTVEMKEKIDEINLSKSDFVWIGLGAPKQEKWMSLHKGKIDGLMVGVGAGFDYHAGMLKRAPNWMQKSNLEWLYRLMQEPKRLFKRYFVTNTKFIWHAVIRGE